MAGDCNRAVTGTRSKPARGVITITITIMIMIMIMMRGHPYNLPTPVIDRLPPVGFLLLTLCDKMCIIWAILSHMREGVNGLAKCFS